MLLSIHIIYNYLALLNNLLFGFPLPASPFQEEKKVIGSRIQKQTAFLCV